MLDSRYRAAFEETLLAGKYSLLVGAGISLDSRDRAGRLLRSTDQLRRDLCALTGARETSSLTRVYSLLSPGQIQAELVSKFSVSTPGLELCILPTYLWRRIFTFNIDDAMEVSYEEHTDPQQVLTALNFDAPFEPDPERDNVQLIHLHGSIRQPESGFVFSTSDYIRIVSSLNPWMHLLSEILASESFIVAGTSLDEVDLEYYLSHRSAVTAQTRAWAFTAYRATPGLCD